MKKNVINLMLFSSLMISALTNAETIKPEAGSELEIWTDAASIKYMKYAAKEFNKENGYKVKFKYRALAPMDSAGRLVQDGGSARVADIAEVEHDFLGELVVSGAIMENLVNANHIKSHFLPSAYAAATNGDVTYGFPVSIATTALFYNKDIYKNAPKTFEEIMDFGKTFNNKRQNKYAFVWDTQDYYQSRMFLSMFGGYEFGNNGTNAKDIGIASENAQKGLAALKTIHESQGFNPFDMRNTQVRRGLFTEGKIAAIVDGPWAIQSYMNSGINLGVAPMPTYQGQKPRTFSTVRLAVVPAYTQYPMAAQLFAQYLTTEKMLKKRFEMTQLIPPVASLMNDLKDSTLPGVSAIIAQAQYSDAMPSIPEMGFIWSPMASAITALVVNDQSPKEVTSQAINIVREQLALQN